MRFLVVGLLVLTSLSGCLSFLDEDDPDAGREAVPPKDVDDPQDISVASVTVVGGGPVPTGEDDLKIPVSTPDRYGNAVSLDAVYYEPVAARSMPGGELPRFPIVVFVHGFGLTKEMFTNAPMGTPDSPDWRPTNLLEEFAQQGFITVGYDARGHGASGGEVSVAAGPEMQDLREVIDHIKGVTNHNGKVGVTGISYGGGHAFRAWADFPDVVTAVPHQGWVDLYDGIIPGNTPKLEWGALLVAEGTATTGGRLHPDVYRWVGEAVTRTNMAGIESDMDGRSIGARIATTDKPLFLCHGLTETLFPQADLVLGHTKAFTRAYIHLGGHGTMDRECWDRTADWFAFWLRGADTGVDAWPFLETHDHVNDRVVTLTEAQVTGIEPTPWYLHEGVLVDYPSMRTFTISQRAINNPFSEPSAVWDMLGQPNPAIPNQMRFADNDPSAVFFVMPPVAESQALVGAPKLDLVLDVPGSVIPAQWQVAALLYTLSADGETVNVAHGAYTHKDGETTPLADLNNTVTIDFHFTKVDLGAGDRLVLKLSANDLSWFFPLTANYDVSFTGESELRLPLLGA